MPENELLEERKPPFGENLRTRRQDQLVDLDAAGASLHTGLAVKALGQAVTECAAQAEVVLGKGLDQGYLAAGTTGLVQNLGKNRTHRPA